MSVHPSVYMFCLFICMSICLSTKLNIKKKQNKMLWTIWIWGRNLTSHYFACWSVCPLLSNPLVCLFTHKSGCLLICMLSCLLTKLDIIKKQKKCFQQFQFGVNITPCVMSLSVCSAAFCPEFCLFGCLFDCPLCICICMSICLYICLVCMYICKPFCL